MVMELHLGETGAAAGGTAVLEGRTQTPAVTPRTFRDRIVERLAGEDEPWADEDFLLVPDAENYVRFLRTLWLAVLVGALFWVMVAFGLFELLGRAGA